MPIFELGRDIVAIYMCGKFEKDWVKGVQVRARTRNVPRPPARMHARPPACLPVVGVHIIRPI